VPEIDTGLMLAVASDAVLKLAGARLKPNPGLGACPPENFREKLSILVSSKATI